MARPNVREQLIEAGLTTLHLFGFNGCAVQDITTAAKVPKGSFYNHFESKEALALEALERYWQNSASRRSLLNDDSLDPVERLKLYFRALADEAENKKFDRGCLIGNFSAELPQNRDVRERLAGMYAAWTRAIESCVREAESAGRVNASLPSADIAAFIVNAWEGAVLRSKVEKDRSAFNQFELVVFSAIFH